MKGLLTFLEPQRARSEKAQAEGAADASTPQQNNTNQPRTRMIKQYPGLQPVERSLTATASSLEGFFARDRRTSATRAINDGGQFLCPFIGARYHLKLPKVDDLSRSSNASRTSGWKRTTNCLFRTSIAFAMDKRWRTMS